MPDPILSAPIKMLFELERDDDGYPPFSFEGLWVHELPSGNVVLDNIPFFAKGVARGDELAVRKDASGAIWYESLVRSSGASVFRLHADSTSEIIGIRADLLDLGLPSEVDAAARLVALEVPQGADIRLALNYLVSGQESGRFDIEEGALRHSLAKSDA